MSEQARVFISCGQRGGGANELPVVMEIKDLLVAEGYSPYVAMAEQSLRALKENLFPILTDSEYFLFLDFRRESIGAQYRGSLFSHQELAISSYLDKDFLGFQEEGVRREGLIDYLQANCVHFSERANLPALVVEEVRRRWNPHWQNRLHIELRNPPYVDAPSDQAGSRGRFFHLRVTNRHRHRTARNCFAYVRSIVDAETRAPVEFESVELKWAGYLFPSATIQPRTSRLLDSLWIPHVGPPRLQFRCFSDWPGAIPRVDSTDVIITYEVVSDSVPGHTTAMRVQVGSTYSDCTVLPFDVKFP